MLLRVALLFLLCCSSVARAEWHEASSEHFVIYADDKADDVAAFARMLERYHAAMSLLTKRKAEAPSPSNRVTIYAVGGEKDIQKLMGGDARRVAGFYIPRAGGSSAFVPDIKLSGGKELDFSVIVLLHEYAHHFLMSTNRYAMPRWLNEGAAEFFASAMFRKDGSLQIGRPAYHRGAELALAEDVTVEELLDYPIYAKRKSKRADAFYGRSWALYHYLTFAEERTGQLSKYWIKVAEGTPPRQAAEEAFGNFDQLQKDLDRYLRASRSLTYDLKPELVPIGEVAVRKLSAGHAAAMPFIIRSRRGVTDDTAQQLLTELREVAALYPADAQMQTALAEAEYDAGNDAEAIAAADRALAIDPTLVNANVQKGYALFRIARDADYEQRTVAYRKAMQPFSALNKLETDHPLPLYYHYLSMKERGLPLTETARHALERAAELAPFDRNLGMEAAVMLAEEGKIEFSRYMLSPIAFDPHGGSIAKLAQAMLSRLETAKEGEPASFAGMIAPLDIDTEELDAK